MTDNRAVERGKIPIQINLITTQNDVLETMTMISFQNKQKENQNVNFTKFSSFGIYWERK